MKPSLSMDNSDQKKTRLKLKKFLTRRPTYQAVRDKGYIKGSQTGHCGSTRTGQSLVSHCRQITCVCADLQIRCLDAAWSACASGKTRRCPTLSKCASIMWRTQVGNMLLWLTVSTWSHDTVYTKELRFYSQPSAEICGVFLLYNLMVTIIRLAGLFRSSWFLE